MELPTKGRLKKKGFTLEVVSYLIHLLLLIVHGGISELGISYEMMAVGTLWGLD
jgi:hypothetical protein